MADSREDKFDIDQHLADLRRKMREDREHGPQPTPQPKESTFSRILRLLVPLFILLAMTVVVIWVLVSYV